jgi:hypothetical protein
MELEDLAVEARHPKLRMRIQQLLNTQKARAS